MLVGAARQNLQSGASRRSPSSLRLYLPWLCPAQLRHEAFSRRISTGSIAPSNASKQKIFNTRGRLLTRRRLATASSPDHLSPYEDSIPFENETSNHGSRLREPSWLHASPASDVGRFDSWSPIIINDSVFASRQTTPRVRRVDDPVDLQRTLEACLRVDRFERATALLRRLINARGRNSPELLESFNQYLSAAVESLRKTRSANQLRIVQKWFEVEMRGNGIEPDATTYALLIKASLQVLQGPRIERTIRRYMDLATQSELDIEVLNLPILSDPELYKVTECCPTDFNKANEILDTEMYEDEPAKAPEVNETSPEAHLSTVPEVRSTEQKGLGLDALKKSISVFSDPSLPESDVTALLERQERLERDAISSAVERWREENVKLHRMGVESALRKRSVGALMWDWQTTMVPLIERDLLLVAKSEAKEAGSGPDLERCQYGPLLRLLPPDKLAAVTILSTMNTVSLGRLDRGIKISSLMVSIGSAVQDEVIINSLQKKDTKPFGYMSPTDRQQKLSKLIKKGNIAKTISNLMKKGNSENANLITSELRSWDNVTKARVGAALLSMLFEAAKVPVTREDPETGRKITKFQPAIYHTYRYLQGKRIGFVGTHAVLTEKLSKEPVHFGLAKNLPMIVEPRKWSGLNSGGYLQTPVKMMRNKVGDVYQNEYVEAAAQKGDLEQVFAGLDVLARTSWRVNGAVLEVMLRIWNSGEELASIPPENPQLSYPAEPDPSLGPKERFKWIKSVKEIENMRSGYHSQRCFQNFQLEIARAFRDEKLYFPHSLDFRGRAYPVPPHFNHMGADNSRGLLMFAEGKELGAKGLNWLKVHLANLYGFDKASLSERRDFTMEHLAEVYDSATNSLDGQRWWLKAEDPWQCLAACMELKNALESPDPTKFKSHLPIHQDGTCNGLQHYAALGGDIMGAKQVNLEPGDRPADVYTGVAEIVKAEIAEDAKSGNEVAKALEGNITRKVVKQTVMTNVYGVTFTGASAQVRKQLAAILPHHDNSSTLHLGILSGYVAKKIFKALSTMFSGAREIQHWLGQCGNRITRAISPEQMDRLENDYENQRQSLARSKVSLFCEKLLDENVRFLSTLIWTTPMRMPVVQPYRGVKSRTLRSTIQSVHIQDPRASDPIDRRRQLQGFPPNFIHSLDATHMLLSALKCDELGLTFAAVHDSFWTHAADIDSMNTVLRDAFIRIHAEDVIGRLEAEFEARYNGYMYAANVRKGSTPFLKIKAWRVSHWGTASMRSELQIQELLLERKRMRLMRSANQEEQKQGSKMITPGSILEESSNREDIIMHDEMTGHGIGEVSGTTAALAKTSSKTLQPEDTGSAPQDHALLNKDDLSEPDDDAEAEAVTPTSEKATRARKMANSHTGTIRVWLPVTFPAKPAKGEFDIQRLKDSQYFFS
ncbi:MAG: hypothetical protein M4579_003558 [Chaenotheca gracillima]|nr:MAG: hypothetical protein M4579_003558 [Chaenotheca gracillima]